MGEEMTKLFPWIYAEDKKMDKIPEKKCLPEACGRGDSSAMLELSEYLRERMLNYEQGANMWLLRAAIYGNQKAQKKLQEVLHQDPYFLKKCVVPYENFLPGRREHWHSGSYPGYLLNALGFLVFQPDKTYMLAGISKERTMVVWQEVDYESPDEDGFGAETYYNMFCLNEFFQYLPGVPAVYNVSAHDIKYLEESKKRYDTMIYAMKKVADKRKKQTLWTEFVPKE